MTSAAAAGRTDRLRNGRGGGGADSAAGRGGGTCLALFEVSDGRMSAAQLGPPPSCGLWAAPLPSGCPAVDPEIAGLSLLLPRTDPYTSRHIHASAANLKNGRGKSSIKN